MGLLRVVKLSPRAGFSAGTKPQTTSSSYNSHTDISHFWNQSNFLFRALQSSLSSKDTPDGDFRLQQKPAMAWEVPNLPASTALVFIPHNLLIKSTIRDTQGASMLESRSFQIERFFPQKPLNIVNSFSMASRACHRQFLPLIPFSYQEKKFHLASRGWPDHLHELLGYLERRTGLLNYKFLSYSVGQRPTCPHLITEHSTLTH